MISNTSFNSINIQNSSIPPASSVEKKTLEEKVSTVYKNTSELVDNIEGKLLESALIAKPKRKPRKKKKKQVSPSTQLVTSFQRIYNSLPKDETKSLSFNDWMSPFMKYSSAQSFVSVFNTYFIVQTRTLKNKLETFPSSNKEVKSSLECLKRLEYFFSKKIHLNETEARHKDWIDSESQDFITNYKCIKSELNSTSFPEKDEFVEFKRHLNLSISFMISLFEQDNLASEILDNLYCVDALYLFDDSRIQIKTKQFSFKESKSELLAFIDIQAEALRDIDITLNSVTMESDCEGLQYSFGLKILFILNQLEKAKQILLLDDICLQSFLESVYVLSSLTRPINILFMNSCSVFPGLLSYINMKGSYGHKINKIRSFDKSIDNTIYTVTLLSKLQAFDLFESNSSICVNALIEGEHQKLRVNLFQEFFNDALEIGQNFLKTIDNSGILISPDITKMFFELVNDNKRFLSFQHKEFLTPREQFQAIKLALRNHIMIENYCIDPLVSQIQVGVELLPTKSSEELESFKTCIENLSDLYEKSLLYLALLREIFNKENFRNDLLPLEPSILEKKAIDESSNVSSEVNIISAIIESKKETLAESKKEEPLVESKKEETLATVPVFKATKVEVLQNIKNKTKSKNFKKLKTEDATESSSLIDQILSMPPELDGWLPHMKRRALLALLKLNNWNVEEDKGKGSHAKATGESGVVLIIPKQEVIKTGTLHSIKKKILENWKRKYEKNCSS